MPWNHHAFAQGFALLNTRPNKPKRACMLFFSSSMIPKRLTFSEPFILLSHRRKIFSGFSLGLGASLLLLSLFLLSNFLRVPKVEVFLPQFNTVNGANSSSPSCPLTFNTNSDNHSYNGNNNNVSDTFVSNRTGEDGIMKALQEEERMGFEDTILANLTENGNISSLHAGDQGYDTEKPDEKNGALVSDKGSLLDPGLKGMASRENGDGNSSMMAKDSNLHLDGKRVAANSSLSGETQKNSSFIPNVGSENNNVSNPSFSGKHEGDLTEKKNNVTVIRGGSSSQVEEMMHIGLNEKCDIFDGKWTRDDSKPYYGYGLGSCPVIDRDFNCHLNGRPDADYVKWKWQPNGCNIPSLNASDFLERLRGQRLVFVGDSLNRNMWESLVCILRQSIRHKKRVFEISGKREFKKKGVYAFRFEDYNCSVDFVVSPFIVRESTFKGKNGSFETLRLDLMEKTTTKYQDADIIVFNTGHWWTHEKTSKGEDYYQEGNRVYPRLKVLDAYTRALTTWARWVDQNIDPNRTQVFFRGYSATHFWGGQWNSGGQCHKETEPIFNETYLQKYPTKMRALEHVIQGMKTPVVYMNISKLTDYRKDGHPSIYRKEYKTSLAADKNSSAVLYEDCSHWCLPGVPDTWNELLYASLLKYGKGAWKR